MRYNSIAERVFNYASDLVSPTAKVLLYVIGMPVAMFLDLLKISVYFVLIVLTLGVIVKY